MWFEPVCSQSGRKLNRIRRRRRCARLWGREYEFAADRLDAVAGAQAGFGKPISRKYREHFEFTSQFEGAERIATKYGITRDDTDRFGLELQLRAARAIGEGRFESQLVPVEVPAPNTDGKQRSAELRTVVRDEVPRKTSMEALAGLKPVARPDGIDTAGSSSQVADGAAAVLLMTVAKAREFAAGRVPG